MSVYDDLASILRKAGAREDELDLGAEVVRIRYAHELQRDRIKELEAENQRLRKLTDEMAELMEFLADHPFPRPRRSLFGDIVQGIAALKKERLDKLKDT